MPRLTLLAAAVLVVAACGQAQSSSSSSPPDVGAGFSDIAMEGHSQQQGGQQGGGQQGGGQQGGGQQGGGQQGGGQQGGGEQKEPAGGHQGAGVFEAGGTVEIREGELSFVGQDVIIHGMVGQLLVGNRAFMVADAGGGQQGGGEQGGGQQGGGQQGGGQQGGGQQGGGQQGGGQQGGGQQAQPCFEQPGMCLLVVLDPAIDASELRIEVGNLVELAGSVMAFEPEAVEQTLEGQTGDFDLSRYPGKTFLLVRILEVMPPPSSGG